MGKPRIRLQNIDKYYYSETSVTHALRNVDLSFEMNEFVAITGESGSGKSTLLKVISGMENFDEGELYIDGQPTSQYDDDEWECYRREKIGYIFQDYSLIGHYTARDNIVCALLIMGMERPEAVQQADRYLATVGLQGMEEQRASELSSGQKQRLSIARALSKGTDIIVADEPTGNLDSDTGEQIVRLLKELSRDHLVIMVTHNYEQVEAYATRKVRLHDGALVMDVSEDHEETEMSDKADRGESTVSDAEDKAGSDPDADNQGKAASLAEDLESSGRNANAAEVSQESSGSDRYVHRVASFLATLNIRTQRGKALMFIVFFCMTAAISFLFIGELLMNADDRIAKEYDPSGFAYEDMRRIVVKHSDNAPMTEQDLETIRRIRHVKTVDQYDNVNDISYYYREEKDYEYKFGYTDYDYQGVAIEFLDESHFMRSTTCISKGDLLAGELPQKRNEVVLYSKAGQDAIGKTFTCYFRNKAIWGTDEYIKMEMKVAGVLKEPTEQLYFSPALCQMMTAELNCVRYTLHFYFDWEMNDWLGKDDFIPLIEEPQQEELQQEEPQQEEPQQEEPQQEEMQVSLHYKAPPDPQLKVPSDPARALGHYNDYLDIYPYRSGRKTSDEPTNIGAGGISTEKFHASTSAFLAMSEETFLEYNDINTYQMSAYISSYAKTTEVIRALEKAGYEALSTYQASVIGYDEEKVENRLIQIVIAAVVLLVLLFAEVLILRSLLRLRIKDYYVMKFMGMQMKLMRRISYYEMGILMAVSMIITVLAMAIASIRFSLLHEMLYYYEVPGCLLYIAYNLLAGMLTVAAFNHLLEGRMDE